MRRRRRAPQSPRKRRERRREAEEDFARLLNPHAVPSARSWKYRYSEEPRYPVRHDPQEAWWVVLWVACLLACVLLFVVCGPVIPPSRGWRPNG